MFGHVRPLTYPKKALISYATLGGSNTLATFIVKSYNTIGEEVDEVYPPKEYWRVMCTKLASFEFTRDGSLLNPDVALSNPACAFHCIGIGQ